MHARYSLFACAGGAQKAQEQAVRHEQVYESNFTSCARFVSVCMQLREEKPDPSRHFDGYPMDLFTSIGECLSSGVPYMFTLI